MNFIEVLVALRRSFQEARFKDTRWETGKKDVVVLRDLLVEYSNPVAAVPRIRVCGVIVDVWDSVFRGAAKDGDVVLVGSTVAVVPGSSAFFEEQEVWAHAHVLKAASPVLRAMLETRFREGEAQRIRTEESAVVLRALVGLIYTGSLSAEVATNVEVLLDTCRLCYRWQLTVLADLLEVRLARMVTRENLEALLEAAVLHDSSVLRCACLNKAEDDVELEAKVRRGEVSPNVAIELRKFFQIAQVVPSSGDAALVSTGGRVLL